MDNLEYVLIVSGQATMGEEKLTGGVEKVSSVGTTILFRCIHSDVKSASEKCWLHTTFQVCALYSTPKLSAHS
jgi:hypothetical protein